MHDPDGDLVGRAKTGDEGAFGKLVKRYYEMAYGLAFGITHEREAARDAAQDAFLKAFRQIGGFEGRSKFKTWLFRIVVNTAIDLVRQSGRTEPFEMRDEDGEEVGAEAFIRDPLPGPRQQASQAELRDRMQEGLKGLSPEHRTVLVLREWQGLSYEEIAEMLQVEVGTVMSRLFYARKKLAVVLKIKFPEGVE